MEPKCVFVHLVNMDVVIGILDDEEVQRPTSIRFKHAWSGPRGPISWFLRELQRIEKGDFPSTLSYFEGGYGQKFPGRIAIPETSVAIAGDFPYPIDPETGPQWPKKEAKA